MTERIRAAAGGCGRPKRRSAIEMQRESGMTIVLLAGTAEAREHLASLATRAAAQTANP